MSIASERANQRAKANVPLLISSIPAREHKHGTADPRGANAAIGTEERDAIRPPFCTATRAFPCIAPQLIFLFLFILPRMMSFSFIQLLIWFPSLSLIMMGQSEKQKKKKLMKVHQYFTSYVTLTIPFLSTYILVIHPLLVTSCLCEMKAII